MLGVDVSNNNGSVDWPAVASAGIQFALCKATEGTSFTDGYYARNVAGARANGLLPGAYHYGRTENSPAQEAGHFLRTAIDELQPGDLIALDIEEASPGADVAAWSLAWLATVQEATGCQPLVYSYPDFIQRHLQDMALAEYPLWLASWQAANPTIPGPWTSYAIWQFQAVGTVAGISGHADVNRTDLDLDELRALGLPTQAPPDYNVGEGVRAAMDRQGDTPIGDEIYYINGFSMTPGAKGIYIYIAQSDTVYRAPKA